MAPASSLRREAISLSATTIDFSPERTDPAETGSERQQTGGDTCRASPATVGGCETRRFTGDSERHRCLLQSRRPVARCSALRARPPLPAFYSHRCCRQRQGDAYIVSGSGGFAATAVKGQNASAGTRVGDHVLEIAPIVEFGYLTIETDGKTLSIIFKTATAAGVAIRDSVAVNLKTGKLQPAGGSTAPPVAGKKASARKRKK